MKQILTTMRLPMSKAQQRKIGLAFYKATVNTNANAAILCQPRVFVPHLSGVWQAKPEWQIAIISPELYGKIQALLVEAQIGAGT